MDVSHSSIDRIPVDVNVEDIHEDRQSKRLSADEIRFVDFCYQDELAVRRRDNDLSTSWARSLGVSEEIRHPESDDRHNYREEPKRPRSPQKRKCERRS